MVALAIASLALATVVYTYAGYPIVIALLARLRKPARESTPRWAELPRVTACVPVYQGEAFVEAKLASLLALDYPPSNLDVVVFSDGSTDATNALVEAVSVRHPGRVTLLRSEQRVGKPTALNRMREVARGDVLLMTDARQLLEPAGLAAMIALLADPAVGCVSGNLVLQGGRGAGAYWRYEKWIRRNEARFRGTVGVTGAIYVIRRSDLAPLPPDLILDDMWVPMRLRLKGRRIAWCDDAIAYDEAFDDEREFGRKVRTLAGNYQLFALLPGLLSPLTNPSWFETLSHKALRLVCPFALVALPLATGAALVGTVPPAMAVVLAAALAGQGAFALLAMSGSRGGKLGALARTFVVLNAAAVVALWRFVRGAQRVTW